ncbi:MAG TPA: ankyrin repeat domain-containing protein, partial [Anaerolineales bacterium]|nr:ankyrin repeat domain-containing protein [Anaerolineales bacterium]
QTYIEEYGYASNTHQIMQLAKGKLETVCKFDVRKVNYVLGEYERILADAKAAYIDPWAYALNMPGTSGLQVLLDAKRDPRYIVRGNNFGTVIHEAIRAQQYDKLEFLLKNGVDPNIVSNNDPIHMTPLHFAIWQQSVEAVRLLVKYGADVQKTGLGQTAIDEVNFQIRSAPLRAEMLKLLSGKQGN